MCNFVVKKVMAVPAEDLIEAGERSRMKVEGKIKYNLWCACFWKFLNIYRYFLQLKSVEYNGDGSAKLQWI